ncbi:hypothetical protein PO124_09640 [Bacillus licheniformis]|nr:hypothetical protein [Bacillus licheniformis]
MQRRRPYIRRRQPRKISDGQQSVAVKAISDGTLVKIQPSIINRNAGLSSVKLPIWITYILRLILKKRNYAISKRRQSGHQSRRGP